MLYGPSTRFRYKPAPPKKPKPYPRPTVYTCFKCGYFIVRLLNPLSARFVYVSLDHFAAHPSLVYIHAHHGPPHYHPPQ